MLFRSQLKKEYPAAKIFAVFVRMPGPACGTRVHPEARPAVCRRRASICRARYWPLSLPDPATASGQSLRLHDNQTLLLGIVAGKAQRLVAEFLRRPGYTNSLCEFHGKRRYRSSTFKELT